MIETQEHWGTTFGEAATQDEIFNLNVPSLQFFFCHYFHRKPKVLPLGMGGGG